MECVNCTFKSKCFEKLNKKEIQYVNSKMKHLVYKKGETIYKQGSFSSNIMFIVEGFAKKYIEGENDSDYIIKILNPSEYVGLSSLFCIEEYCYCSVSAITDTTLCSIKKEDFKKIIANNNNFAQEIIKWYCQDEEFIFKKLKSINSKNMNGRLAEVILYLNNIKFNELNAFVTRKMLAELAGISTESTIRILSDFRKEKIISTEKKAIKILNLELLKNICKNG